jgi:hypothetical protein
VEDRRHPQHRRDLPNRALILEPKRKQEAIRRFQLVERLPKRVHQLLPPESCVSVGRRRRGQPIRIDFGDDEILEAAARHLLGTPDVVVGSWAAITVAVMIQQKPPRDDDEPRREPGFGARRVSTQPAAVVRTERLEHMRVAIQRGVTIARERATRVQNDAAVRSDKLCPGLLPLGAVGRVQEAGEFSRRVGWLPEVVRRGVPTPVGGVLAAHLTDGRPRVALGHSAARIMGRPSSDA